MAQISNQLTGNSVLLLLSDVEFGGIAVQAREQASYLGGKGICRSLLLLNTNGVNLDDYNPCSDVISTEVVPSTLKQVSSPLRVYRLWKLFRNRPESIFHFHSFSQEYINWQAVLAARLAKKSVVVTLHHTVRWTRDPFDPTFVFQRLAWLLANRLVVTTRAGKVLVEQKIPTGKTEVVPCIIPNIVNPVTRDSARNALNVCNNDFLVVVVSRLVQSKGIIDLVKTVLALSNHQPMRLLIAGDGHCRSELSELVKDDHRIRLLGHVQDKNSVFAAADLFALPSYEEGFGMVYAEAARHGVPSIASDLPQVREVVVDGETGWLVPPGDVERLRTTIDWVFKHRDECLRRGENAKSYCRRFDPDVVMARQILIYDDLLKAI